MTTTDNIDWSELLEHPIVTAQHSNGKNRIAAATDTLQQTAQQLVEVLNERARLLATSALFETVLRDAAAIRAIIPGAGIGYLCTGYVYCQQGHYAAAISIYDQGLQAVLESDVYYQQLQHHRTTAIDSNDKRVDFISQLPWDIVITNIVPRMQPEFCTESSCKLLYVSRSWQNRILQQPKGLRFSFGKETTTFKNGHAQLIRFAPYVQTLSGSLLNVRLDDLFSRAHFSNLKKLNVMCDDPEIPRLPLIHGLELIADSLTRLVICGCPDLQLRDILETCPNLEFLQTRDVDAIMPLSPSSIYPKMTRLALFSISETTRSQHDNMIDVLCRFPSLRSLEVDRVPESSVLCILHEHCPYLKILCLGVIYSPYDQMNVQRNRKGISWAYLSERVGDMLIIDAKIKANNPTLELSNGEIVEAGDYDPLAASTTPVVVEEDDTSNTLFTRLTEMSFSDYDYASAEAFIIWLILKAPNLKAIHLPASHLQPRIAYIMTKAAKHLSKLEIFHKRGGTDTDGIKKFSEYHIGLGNQSTLKEMIVEGREMSNISWVPLIFKLRCLKNLSLHVNTISEECLSAWEEIGQGCPALEKLTLGMDGAELVDGVMMPLRHLEKLKFVRIMAQKLSGADLAVLAAIPSLEELYLHCRVENFMIRALDTGTGKPRIIVDNPEDGY
ncbi:predicted protein [Lichtheimia corymbifera JMRC:FSU:9682]|uniref:F-box domain-containing protein n=1 Tax=Lichtheimia corymbifera JMRC:FSU:9682 TaxID=1263082 RepID=A0A068S0M7_9FUNG|nr:predicted protein [Lichtheimia corymbifera JMRC:FSU:9682]